MGEVVFRLLAGAAFILAGRWVYANPGRLLESSLYSGGIFPSAFGRLWVRGFATLLIFLGLFAIVSFPAVLLFGYGNLGLLLGLAACVLGAIFLRPRARGARAPLDGAAATPSRGALLTRKGKLIVATSVGGGIAVFIETLLLLRLGLGRQWPDVTLLAILAISGGWRVL